MNRQNIEVKDESNRNFKIYYLEVSNRTNLLLSLVVKTWNYLRDYYSIRLDS